MHAEFHSGEMQEEAGGPLDDEFYIESVKQFNSILKGNQAWTRECKKLVIDLADGALKSSDQSVLTKGLAKISGVVTLEVYLFNCKISDEILAGLLGIILTKNKQSIREVKMDLTENALTSQTLQFLFQAVADLPALTKLSADLTSNVLSRGGVASFGPLASPTLRFLKLNLEDSGASAAAIGAVLLGAKHLPELQTLVLNATGCSGFVSSEAVDSLLESSVKNLDLNFSRYQFDCVRCLLTSSVAFINRFAKLRLDLSGCLQLDEAGTAEFLQEQIHRFESTACSSKMDEESTLPSAKQSLKKRGEKMKEELGLDLAEFEELLEMELADLDAGSQLPAQAPPKSDKALLLRDCLKSPDTKQKARQLFASYLNTLVEV